MVGRNHHAGSCRHRVDQIERGEGATLGEETTSRTQYQRVDQQRKFVHEIAPHERPDQLSAAEHDDILPWLLLQCGHRFGGVALEQR